MKSSFVFVLLLSVMAVCRTRSYIYVSNAMNWHSAQTYCKNSYLDLATITTDEENQRLMNASAAFGYSDAWIGLYRTAPRSVTWQWSDGESANFFNWASNQPDNCENKEDCGMVFPSGWNDNDCGSPLPFYCTWKFVLVNDRKTWEEALDYCRTHYIGLASPNSGEQIALAENAAPQIQSVWTDLHFVNGKWVWVNTVLQTGQASLMICPAPRYRCGALNTESNLWENRDCSEKLHFVCY